MLSDRPQGPLPSNTKTNPKEQVKAITLRSEKQVEQPQEIFKEVVAHEKTEASMEEQGKVSDHEAQPKNSPKSNLMFHLFLFLKGLEGIN